MYVQRGTFGVDTYFKNLKGSAASCPLPDGLKEHSPAILPYIYPFIVSWASN